MSQAVPPPTRPHLAVEQVQTATVGNAHGIRLGEEYLFVMIEHLIEERQWRFRLRDLRQQPVLPQSSWFTLQDPEQLRRNGNARRLRDLIGGEFDDLDGVIDMIIARIQENEVYFMVEPEDEEEAGGANSEPLHLSDEEWGRVEEILNNPNPMRHIKTLLDQVIAGEDDNKQIIFVILLGGKSHETYLKQMVLIKGESGAGKSTLMGIADYFKVKEVGRFTKHALDWATDLANYEVLKLKELGNSDNEDEGISTIRFLSSDDKGYVVEAPFRDPHTGRMVNQTNRIPPITIISSTTRVDIEKQYNRRNWIFNPDESRDQTERIRQWQVRHEEELSRVSLGIMRETRKEYAERILRGVIQRLEMCTVHVTFNDALTNLLEGRNLRVRGDYSRLITLVKLYGILNQRNLPHIDLTDRREVIMTPEKAMEILQLAIGPLTAMTSSIENRESKIFKLLKDFDCTYKNAAIDRKLRARISAEGESNPSDDTIRGYLRQLELSGYMTSEDLGKREGKVWYLLYDLDEIERRMSVISDRLSRPATMITQMWDQEIAYLESLVAEEQPEEPTAGEEDAPAEMVVVPEVGDFSEISPELRTAISALLPMLRQLRNAQTPQVEAEARAQATVEAGRAGPEATVPTTLTAPGRETLFVLMKRGTDFFIEECFYKELVDEEGIHQALGIERETLTRILSAMSRDSGCPVFSPYPGKWKTK